jgi:signal transduction histidine kinase
LLDVSRLEAGAMPLNRVRADLAQVTREAIARLEGMDRDREYVVDVTGDVSVTCDAGIIRRVIENLMSNAIKHTPEGGRVRFVLARTGDGVRVSVIDQGPGVPVDARAKIFEKFGTLDAKEQRAHHSAGLGLAFCKLAVEAHGGTIGVADAHPTGSEFWFDLPA